MGKSNPTKISKLISENIKYNNGLLYEEEIQDDPNSIYGDIEDDNQEISKPIAPIAKTNQKDPAVLVINEILKQGLFFDISNKQIVKIINLFYKKANQQPPQTQEQWIQKIKQISPEHLNELTDINFYTQRPENIISRNTQNNKLTPAIIKTIHGNVLKCDHITEYDNYYVIGFDYGKGRTTQLCKIRKTLRYNPIFGTFTRNQAEEKFTVKYNFRHFITMQKESAVSIKLL